MTEKVLGTHEKAVRRVSYSASEGILVSGSWDKTIKLWDIKGDRYCISSHVLPGKGDTRK